VSRTGLLLAVASGAVASGVGYSIWYTAMRGLTAMRAAVVQLSVPVIAAAGGVLLLGEAVGLRLVVSTVAILGGVAFILSRR
jgi:drug/metabolite transporter (DMT)-like permease